MGSKAVGPDPKLEDSVQREKEATRAAVEAAARAYYGAQDLLRPGDADLQARLRASWDAGRVLPEAAQQCRDAVRPLVLDALAAYRAAGQ